MFSLIIIIWVTYTLKVGMEFFISNAVQLSEAVVEGTPANNVMLCSLLKICVNPGDASTPERLRITKDGKVGINDTSPDANLSVGGSTAFIDVGAAGGNSGKIGYSSNIYILELHHLVVTALYI